jgi:hypothetical protein
VALLGGSLQLIQLHLGQHDLARSRVHRGTRRRCLELALGVSQARAPVCNVGFHGNDLEVGGMPGAARFLIPPMIASCAWQKHGLMRILGDAIVGYEMT